MSGRADGARVEHPAYEVLRPVTEAAAVVLADNPSVMTLDGTNSWVLRAPGPRGCIVVDPGPDEPAHLDLLAGQGPVELVLLTHRHLDHSAGARSFAERVGAPVRALDPTLVLGAEGYDEMIDTDQRVSAAKLGESGFWFAQGTLAEALRHALMR